MNKAVFLDRDGVLNRDYLPYQYKVEHIHINPGVIETLKELQERNYILIIITNQGGIAKGIYDHKDVEKVNNFICSHFEKEKIKITEIYYCPHHDSISACICRKPDSVMLEKAMARFNIDKQLSYFVGDNKGDVEAALKAGVTPVKVDANNDMTLILSKIR